MKRLFTACVLLLFAAASHAQSARQREPDLNNALTLLKMAGYELYCFDVPATSGEVVFEVWEYGQGELLMQSNLGVYEGDTPLRVNIGFYPAAADSLKQMMYEAEDMGAGSQRLTLQPLRRDGQEFYNYGTRPFKVGEMKAGFTPLVLLGSFWFDSDEGLMMRFCGANEIDPDMSSEILKNIPHYYVIGVRVETED